MFKPVEPRPDFPKKEKERLKHWYSKKIIQSYLSKNDLSDRRFSFQDGPITANNPMGVHHAWGRTYKDIWQKFYNLLGYRQRFQNGFDCQGLWVEVEVEKELGIRNKKEIENLVPGDTTASVAKFVQMCKDRVLTFAEVQTEQSKRLGYFMDWDNSYFTMSDANNYMIWRFLHVCHEHGWIYKGRDAVAWCPRCQTAISQHEMLTEDYRELSHESLFVTLPIETDGWENTSLLIWTTTPWTIPANVAVGVNTEFTYGVWQNDEGESVIFLHTDAEGNVPQRQLKKKSLSIDEYILHDLNSTYRHVKDISGKELIGLRYTAPFDTLRRVEDAKNEKPETFHTVIDASKLVNAEEGTGLLHVAPGAGTEDFRIGKEADLSVISVIADDASYLKDLGELSGKNAKKHPELIIDALKDRNGRNWLLKTLVYTHRYPACWRCKTELVWKVADEWYIGMDTASAATGRTFREMMIKNAKKITWLPEFGLDRELDWLQNMDDWLISKKNRYWGLALPIYECTSCGNFTVIRSREELEEKAVEGWDAFGGHSPHKPYIDKVKIACSGCGAAVSRIEDVGNPWLDAGIVPFSTISENNDTIPLYTADTEKWREWFPVDFITESFPGQFKNWFYALIAMATALEDDIPFRTVLGFGTLLAEDGRAMHKSWGNSIEFNEGADTIGVDVMRWMYAKANPAENMLFGYTLGDSVRRSFILMVWNIYKFFVDYAVLDGFSTQSLPDKPHKTQHILDAWIIERLHQVILESEKAYREYSVRSVTEHAEALIQDISTWYIRRSRDRVWQNSSDNKDKKSFYETLHYVLVHISIILSPIIPYITDEMYVNLTGHTSVHLAGWPDHIKTIDTKLIRRMEYVRKIVEAGHRARKEAKIKVRQPLAAVTCTYPTEWVEMISAEDNEDFLNIVKSELNVRTVDLKPDKVASPHAVYDLTLTDELKAEGEAREIVREVQQERRSQELQQSDEIVLTLPDYPETYKDYIKQKVIAKEIKKGQKLHIEKA